MDKLATLEKSLFEPPARKEEFYTDVIEKLAKSEIPFLLSGTYALGFYTGIVRPTKDVDVFSTAGDCLKILSYFKGKGVDVEIVPERGVPPVVNEAGAVAELAVAASRISSDAACDTEQSLGGEDFGWFLEKVPGALARLGVGRPGTERVDLHQPTFDVDESASGVGVRLLANAVQLP